ncbi:hypothetical protein CTEN210_01791 [Chaetoceros tenuissimus]|uniref:Exostosin GT47 domain-containing protein n=1 Tax=Chaetoceros tenuissimus TaxID=426638 RepID=A0AAD3GZR8_9STRA|nr:hypothetical protein CTEN210_01791 [Chaetoceros tenuissimus]
MKRRRKSKTIIPTFLASLIILYLGTLVFLLNTNTRQSLQILPLNVNETVATDSIKLSHTQQNDLLLTTPFYIYEELDWLDETHHVTTVGNHTFREWIELSAEERNFEMKHDDDLKFYVAATRHPMRVENPEDAKLFVVPMLTSYIATNYLYKDERVRICRNNICGRDLLFFADELLQNSTWFQKSQGKDHFVLVTSLLWQHHHKLERWKYEHMERCNILQFGEGDDAWNKKHDRISFNTFYVGSRCPSIPFQEKKFDIAMIADLRFRFKDEGTTKRFQDRRNICNWTKSSTFTSKYSMSICGKGAQCPSLANSRLGWHPRGDTISANRLFDTLLSGTIPIFTDELQLRSHQNFIRWDMLSYFIQMGPNKTQDYFLEALDAVLKNSTDMNEKTKNIIENRDLFDWDTLVPFDVYMYMLQSHLWPHTRISTSKYSALILPPITTSSTTRPT